MRRIQILQLLFYLLLAVGTSSCIDDLFISGNGNVRTENRNVQGFTEIASSGDFDVTVTAGTSYSLEVKAESNLLPYIVTAKNGHSLNISTQGLHSLRQNFPIEIHITTPTLNRVALSGSGSIVTDSFPCENFDAVLSGSGRIETEVIARSVKANVSGSGAIVIEGEAIETEFVISGSGSIRAYSLLHDYCEAAISGSGDMYVNANKTIDAHISGSGRVYYINNPVVHTRISGSGDVVDKN